jgi:hypothetical protein
MPAIHAGMMEANVRQESCFAERWRNQKTPDRKEERLEANRSHGVD